MKYGFLLLVFLLLGCTSQSPRFSATGTEVGCKPKYLTDNNEATYWTCNGEIAKPVIELTYNKPTAVDEIQVQEFEQEPSRVAAYLLEGCAGGVWLQLGYAYRNDGNPVCMTFSGIMVTQLRLTLVLKENARSPKISAINVLCSPAGEAQARTYDF